MNGLLAPCSLDGFILEVPNLGVGHGTPRLVRVPETPSDTDLHDLLQPLEPDEQAAYIQSHIFFDLLINQSLNGLLRDQDFTAYNADRRPIIMVRPATMSRAVLRWNLYLASSSPDEQNQSFKSLRDLLKSAEAQCDRIDYPATNRRESYQWKIYGVVLLSIRLLIDYLHSVLEASEGARDLRHDLHAKMQYRELGRERYQELARQTKARSRIHPLPPGGHITMTLRVILDLFELNGWCAVQARRMCQRANYAEAVSLSHIKSTATIRGHVDCLSEGRCIAFDLSEQEIATYSRTHAHQHDCDASCELLSGSLKNKLHMIVESGRIPIVSMDLSAPDLDLRIGVNDGTRPYTAISHVWSDGLGNPHCNELSRCKLESLRKIIRDSKEKREMSIPSLERFYAKIEDAMLFPKTRSRLYFWMDTLCIPTDPKHLRKKSMRHITPIFQGADQVVIVDADLQQYKPKKQESVWDIAFRENIIAHMLASKWSTRAWTLEEGALARNCQVQLEGDLVSLDQVTHAEVNWFSVQISKIWKKWITDIDQIKESTLFHISLNPMLADILNEPRKRAARPGSSGDIARDRRLFQETRSSQFVTAWNELLERSATRQGDRVLIMANILDFNVEQLSALPREHRLPLLIESCHQIPISLMFNTECDSTGIAHSSRAWLPTDIRGDRMVSSTLIDMRDSKETGRCKLPSGLGNLICIKVNVLIPHGVRKFCILDAERRLEFVVEILHGESVSAEDEQYYGAGSSTFLIIDPATGTSSLNGYTGRGARLSIQPNQGEPVLLGFDRPLKAWSTEQWSYKTGHQPDFPTYEGLGSRITSNIFELDMRKCLHSFERII